MIQLLPIGILLAVVLVVIARLPRVEIGHSDAFRTRRFLNWFPLGLTYAFLYMERYNLNSVKTLGVLSEHDYGDIYAVGAACYGLSFFLNGPLTDRFGGKRAILVAAAGSGLMNLLMGLAARGAYLKGSIHLYELLFGVNMYFQSFGAVAIIKVNSAWFHVRERGVFGGIFGILISLGLYFAFDWCLAIGKKNLEWNPGHVELVFLIPSAISFAFFAICLAIVRDTPSLAGHPDFDTGDASSGDTGPPASVVVVLVRMLTSPIIPTIAAIEFCSGFLRDSIMHWYRDFAAATGGGEAFVSKNWGMLLCVAGIMGGTLAGIVSDRFFDSRRPPVAAVLYSIMVAGALGMLAIMTVAPLAAGWIVIFMVMSVIGVHGVLSGTASADFGGKKNAGVATGLIDGCVYAGTAVQSVLLGRWLPAKDAPQAHDPANWRVWALTMFPIAAAGLFLATLVRNARPKAASAPVLPPSKRPRRATRESQSKTLDQVLEAARSAGSKGVAVLDLDSTVFDNRPRQAAILREFAPGRVPDLQNVEASHVDGWDLRVAMANAGLPREKAESLLADVKAFWRERFFTSEYCKLDQAVPGAASFLSVLQETGVQIAFVTGRHEAMREGTVACMKKLGIPEPDGKCVHLFLKPTIQEDDDAWKVRAQEPLRGLGRVVAVFENEPTHANAYKQAFPEAHVVHLDTDDSGRPVAVAASIPSVLDFLRI